MSEATELMKQEILPRLDALADRLGVSVEYIWPIFVKEQFAHGMAIMAAAAFGFMLSIVLVGAAVRLIQKSDGNENYQIGGMVCGVVSIFPGVVSIIEGTGALPLLIAPEAAALRSLMETIK